MKKRSTRLTAGVAVLALVVGFTSACTDLVGSGDASEAQDRAVTFGVDRGPYSMDPYRAALGGAFMAYLDPVYDTLIRMEPDGSFIPGLAEEWEYESPSEFRITLREGLIFHGSGSPLGAEAVKANLDRLTSVVGPMSSELADDYGSTEVVDEYTVIVHLSGPNPDLERIFSQVLGMMVDPATFDDPDALALTPAGAGPYVLDEARTVPDDTYVYTRTEAYWDEESFPFEELTIRVYTDGNAMLSALESGVATVGYGAPDNVRAAEGFGLEVASLPVNVMTLVLTDRERPESPLSNQKIRQAINYAVDRGAILETVYSGEGVTTTQLFLEGAATGYDPALEDNFTYNPERARELVEEAGFGDGVTISTGVPIAARDTVLAEALASYLAEVGITLEIVALPPGTYGLEAWKPYNSITGSFAPQGAFADTKLIGMPTGSGFNAHASQDDTVDTLWSEGAEAATTEARQASFAQLSAHLQELSWFVPIVRLNAIALYDGDKVGNVHLPPGISTPRVRDWTIPGE
ncbi:MAG: ABC transporter substrate-binding protein [Pseudoclavibacter sp.]